MMTHLFYFTTIFFLFKEIQWLYSPRERVDEVKKFSELSKLNKGKKWDDYSEEYKSALKSKVFVIFIPLWMFVGLFTFQWVAFLIMLLFNFVIIAPFSQLTKYSFAYLILHWINSVIGFAFGIFVILNHYHLHLNVWHLLCVLFKIDN